MDYNIIKINSENNKKQTNNNCKEIFFTKKNLKNISNENTILNTNTFINKSVSTLTNINTQQLTHLQNKINELEYKLNFYKKYENNLSNGDLNIINNSIEIIDVLINIFTKNIINKGQVNRTNKQIEFEF